MTSSPPLPVNLITGLLGSGKTTTLKHLITQKPSEETWAILINEFGDIGIDAASMSENANLMIKEVSGGCICCTAQFGLQQALQSLLINLKIDRLIIEPTGLGHPAKLLDTLQHTNYPRILELQTQLCILNPQHLTPERWQKSAVMRDLITLSDVIVLNKIDLCSPEQLHQAHSILDRCYPPKTQRLITRFGQVALSELMSAHQVSPFIFLCGLEAHHQAVASQTETFESQLSGLIHHQMQLGDHTFAIGWVWLNAVQFNRVKLKTCFETWQPYLLRAKGILKTGLEWQLLNGSDQQLEFSDVAWRQDSRLELIFDTQNTPPSPREIEQQLKNTMILKD